MISKHAENFASPKHYPEFIDHTLQLMVAILFSIKYN
jgi:hypothetical protein